MQGVRLWRQQPPSWSSFVKCLMCWGPGTRLQLCDCYSFKSCFLLVVVQVPEGTRLQSLSLLGKYDMEMSRALTGGNGAFLTTNIIEAQMCQKMNHFWNSALNFPCFLLTVKAILLLLFLSVAPQPLTISHVFLKESLLMPRLSNLPHSCRYIAKSCPRQHVIYFAHGPCKV